MFALKSFRLPRSSALRRQRSVRADARAPCASRRASSSFAVQFRRHHERAASPDSWGSGSYLGFMVGAALLAVAEATAQEEEAEKYPEWCKPKPIHQQSEWDGQPFPLVLGPGKLQTEEEFRSNLRQDKQWVLEQLMKYGAIVFRGFPINNPSNFNDFVHSFGLKELPYVGGAAPRHQVVGAVFTTNESPPGVYIPFHHEMAQVPNFPHKLFFYCDTPPNSGGQTSIIPSWIVYRLVEQKHPQFVKDLVQKGVRYRRVMPYDDDNESAQGRSWRKTFLTDSKDEAIAKLQSQGSVGVWTNGGQDLDVVSRVLPAIKFDERTGRYTWFNSLLAAHPDFGWKDRRNDPAAACLFGDNTPLDSNIVKDVLSIMRANKTTIDWQKGDVMMIDNRTVMHSREVFEPPRMVMASLWTDSAPATSTACPIPAAKSTVCPIPTTRAAPIKRNIRVVRVPKDAV